MFSTFAIRYKRNNDIFMGVEYSKRGNTYFPAYFKPDMADTSISVSKEIWIDSGEYFNDTWNQHTILWEMQMWSELPEDKENVFCNPRFRDKNGVIEDFIFNREEWEVVEIKLNFRVVAQDY